jgi:SAM-dependent methyltransferase
MSIRFQSQGKTHMMNNWIMYWDRRDSMSGALWQAQADCFTRRIRREIPFGPEDVLLDIGCGNGHVTAALAELVREAHGADTSAYTIEQAGMRYKNRGNLHFHILSPEAYLDIDKLPLGNVTRILCVSVVQYYASLAELRTLIANAKRLAAPGCLMLLADLLIDYSLCKDIFGVLLGGLRSGTLCAKLREAVSGRHSLYARIRSENPVLTMTRRDVEEVCAAEAVSLQFIPRNLTGNCFRAHALITLSPATRGG